MILFTFENDINTAIKTEAFTSAREQFTCSDVIPTCPMLQFLGQRVTIRLLVLWQINVFLISIQNYDGQLMTCI